MTQEKLSVIDVQSFRSWEALNEREAKVARHLCVLTWCEGIDQVRVELRELARATHMRPRSAEEALRSLLERGALSRLKFYSPGGSALVALTPRWRMDEEASP